MRTKAILLGLAISFTATLAFSQGNSPADKVTPLALYCSGVITTEHIEKPAQLITGEGSNYKITFQDSDYVYVDRGADKGVKVGDEFLAVRAVSDPDPEKWFKSEQGLLNRMGIIWEDEGRVRIVKVLDKVSIGQVENSCSYLLRGDPLVPFEERLAPPLKPDDHFDRFADPNGKALATVVTGKSFQQTYGAQDIVYVNLGASEGVKVGDYFRMFRYQGNHGEVAYQTPRMPFKLYGFGGVSIFYGPKSVPREILGEGVVLRTGTHASTVLITHTVQQVYAGDYVELE